MSQSPPALAREGVLTKLSRNFNGRLTYAVVIIALSQVNFGLEQGVFSNTQAMTPLVKRFGVYNANKKTYGSVTNSGA